MKKEIEALVWYIVNSYKFLPKRWFLFFPPVFFYSSHIFSLRNIMEPNENAEIKYTLNFINNEWKHSASGKTFDVINPATEDVICQVAEGDKEDVNQAVKVISVCVRLSVSLSSGRRRQGRCRSGGQGDPCPCPSVCQSAKWRKETRKMSIRRSR